MPETSAIRAKTRRVKDIILDQFLEFADRKTPLKESEQTLYHELMMTFARNVVPRTQEITGEDGEALQVSLVKYADNPTAVQVPAESIPTAAPTSV